MSEKVDKGIDIRIIQLGKWQLPRTKPIEKTMTDIDYLSIGYFDMIRVLEAKVDKEKHLFLNAYNNLPRQSNCDTVCAQTEEMMEEYSIQEIIGYTNVGEQGFAIDTIEEFWKEKSFLLFVSLIHIDNDSHIENILKEIRRIFDGKKYLYYFSLDYSGIILIFKGYSVEEYLKLLFQLNYDCDNPRVKEKLIRDSYSFYGFEKKWLLECFDRFEKAEQSEEVFCLKEQLQKEDVTSIEAENIRHQLKEKLYSDVKICENDMEKFSAAINFSVQNFKAYQDIKDKIELVTASEQTYGMLGRHDISIVENNANLKWLVYMQYVLNTLFRTNMGNDENSFDGLLSAHETFVKIGEMGNYTDTSIDTKNKVYKKAKVELDTICSELKQRLEENNYNGDYFRPIRAIKYSLLSILKNRYAEDFVLSIYRPIIGFLKYLENKISEEKSTGLVRTSEFDRCYKDFFACLSSLVNCAMHSERQFIQATDFNAVIYDVPSKLLAFYMVLINDIKEIMREKGDKEYTFILCPSFSNEIGVQVISYHDENKLPHDRVLKVEISEKSLYNPPEVESVLVHEIGHFLGDELRQRDVRANRIRFSIVFLMLAQVYSPVFWENSDKMNKLANDISEYLKDIRGFKEEECKYSVNLILLGTKIAEEFQNNPIIEEKLYLFTRDALENSEVIRHSQYMQTVIQKHMGTGLAIEDIDVLSRMVIEELKESSRYVSIERYCRLVRSGETDQSIIYEDKTKNLNNDPIGQVTKSIVRMYREAYSDIQKILVTGISYQEYLQGFFRNNNVERTNMGRNFEDMGRISMVSLVLEKCGIWECKVDDTRLCDLNNSVMKTMQDVFVICNKEEMFKRFRAKYEEQIQEIKCEGVKNALEKEQYSTSELPEKSSYITNRIYYELLRYLYHCTEKSIVEYSEDKKKRMIKQLREVIKLINECQDIQQVFVKVNEKIKEYKKEIFDLESDEIDGENSDLELMVEVGNC